MSNSVGRIRDLVRALIAESLANPLPGVVYRRQAIVTAVNAGPPKTLSLKLDASGAVFPARYLDSLATPAVGNTVWVDFLGADPVVVGRLA